MMHQQAILTTKIKELQSRWERLSQLLEALHLQRDLETRADERLRLDILITERETVREQVAAQLQDMEQVLSAMHPQQAAASLLPRHQKRYLLLDPRDR